jgi:hypothetical protein
MELVFILQFCNFSFKDTYYVAYQLDIILNYSTNRAQKVDFLEKGRKVHCLQCQ